MGGSRGRRDGLLGSVFGASCQGACQARCERSSPSLACFVGRPGQEEGPCWLAPSPFCWLAPPPFCWLTFPSSSHSHCFILTVIPKVHCKLPKTAYKILPGLPGCHPCNFRKTRTGFGLPSGTAQNFVIYSGSRTGCTSLSCQQLHFTLAATIS